MTIFTHRRGHVSSIAGTLVDAGFKEILDYTRDLRVESLLRVRRWSVSWPARCPACSHSHDLPPDDWMKLPSRHDRQT
jgi:hypothetical protein